MVRELREMTGAAMMDCKKALEASGGDLDAAVDHLRKQGMKSAEKKASRDTAEGRVLSALSDDGRRGHMLAVACETDFLAKGQGFIDFVGEIEKHVISQDPDGLDSGSRPFLEQRWMGEGQPVAERLREAVGSLKENIQVTKLVRMESPEGRVGAYIHHDHKQGALVSLKTSASGEKADEVLRGLCQHIVVFRPRYARREAVPASEVEHEKSVLRESDEVKKKPAEFQDRIIEGKLGKFYAGIVLADQPWIHDDKTTVLKALQKELGADTEILEFAHVVIGG